MSLDESQDLPRSMKSLWTLLSGSLNLKSLQFIADELEQNQRQLIEGILYFKPHDPKLNSLDVLKKKKLPGLTPEILYNMSIFLDLNAEACNCLFQSYLLYEYKGTPEMAKSLFTNEKQMRELFEKLWHYYYSERIFSLFCLKQIISNWKTSDHIYTKIFHDFLKHVNADNQLITKLINQLKHLISFSSFSRTKYGQYFTESFQQDLKENILKEQIEVLELMLIYYKNFAPSLQNVYDLLKMFVENGFESKVISSNNLTHFIAFLKALLIVQCLDLHNLYKCHIDGLDHSLIKNENANLIKCFYSLILNMNTSATEHSLIFMSWMIANILTEGNNKNCERLGLAALELKIFNYLSQCLTSSQMTILKGSCVHDLIYEIIGNLLVVTFTLFDFQKFIQNEHSLSSLMIQLFSNDVIGKIIYESSLESGLGQSIRYYLDLFPFKTHYLLSLLYSLSQTSSCKNIFERMSILNTLTTYTEKFDNSIHYASIDSDSLQLAEDRYIFANTDLVIRMSTKGRMFYHSSDRLIKWNNVTIDGWKLLYYRLRYLINQMKQGKMYDTMMNDEVALNEISKVAFICAELIAHNSHQNISHFKSIVKLLLESFKLLVNFNQTSIRLFISGVIWLCVNIMKFNYLPIEQVWFVLTEKEFFPYMIGFSNKFDEIIAGTDTNISTLGYILSSDEFIKGNYELTFSFLELILYCAKKNAFLTENTVIASFILIAKDIFPSYKLWNYKNEQDANKIGRLCMKIFYHILNRARKKPTNQLEQIEKVCTILLMEGNSAEYLLHLIKSGEEIVKNKILNSGNDSLLVKDDQIITVRTSLLILSYLLELYSEVSKLSFHKKKSVIEDILFSSTNNSNPNMLLIFTYFVYQKYDIHLATNAIQLLSQLAFKFPMSMLACFGSNTEFIRDHFLFRLETLTEDINFKIALLNFLSICVEHQPGLVEMFLNVSNNQRGVLNSILEILEEKLEGQYFCPFELHQASLGFVAKFWLRPNIIAINLLKKCNKFWKLVTFPLFENKEHFNNSLCSFVLKIISREIFYAKILEKDTVSEDLKEIFDKMKNESIFQKLSTHIHDNIISVLQIDQDAISFIDAWKDFLASWAKFQLFPIDSSIEKVINDIMKNLLILLSNNNDNQYTKVINKFTNLLLIISSNWKPNEIEMSKQDFKDNIFEIFKNVNINKEFISFNSLISLSTFLLKVLDNNDELNQTELFQCVCRLLSTSIQLINKQLSMAKAQNSLPKDLAQEKKLVTLNLFTAIKMFQNSNVEHQKYLDILRRNEISELILNLFIYLIHHNTHLDLGQNLPLFFVALSCNSSGADLLYNLNIINNISIYFRLPNDLFLSKLDDPHHNCVSNIFSLLIRVVINMIVHLKFHFIESSISFIAIYSDSFKQLCTNFCQFPKIKSANLILLIFELCASLSKYIKQWRSSHEISLKIITREILATSNSVIAFLLRPNKFAQSIDNSSGTADVVFSYSQFMHRKTETFKDQELLFGDVQILMSQILLHSFKFILDITPNLFDLFEDETANNEKYDLLLSTNFSIPNPDSLELLSFGSLVNLINFTIKRIYKLEKDLGVRINHSINIIKGIDLNISLLELSLQILLIQILIATNSSKINQMDRQIFFREINNEVNAFKLNLLSKPQRRQNSVSTITGQSPVKSSNINLIERQFIKLILHLLENVMQ